MFQKINLIGFFIFFLLPSSFGQSLEKDLKSISNAMDSSNSVSIKVKAKMYSHKGGSLTYEASASMEKKDSNYRTVLGEIEFIQTPSYHLRLDHDEKEILILKQVQPGKQSKKKKEKIELELTEFTKFIEKESGNSTVKINLISNSEGRKKYSVKGVDGVKEMQLELDLNAKKIINVSYEYEGEGGQYVVLQYTSFTYNSDLSGVFQLKKYFTVNGQSITLNEKYKSYQLFTEE